MYLACDLVLSVEVRWLLWKQRHWKIYMTVNFGSKYIIMKIKKTLNYKVKNVPY